MTLQYSEALRNAQLATIEATIGASAVLKIRTGSVPADVAASDTGDVLATLALPSSYLAVPSGGQVAKDGTWEDSAADDDGVAAHWRLYEDDGTTCHMQGTVTITGGGGDLTVNNTSFATGQAFTITSWTITAGNA